MAKDTKSKPPSKGGKSAPPVAAPGTFVSERVPNPNIQEVAQQMHYAALVANSAWHMLPKSLHRLPKPVAAIVNAAFAMELYVKSLYSTLTLGDPSSGRHGLNKPVATGHGPGELFRKMHQAPRYKTLGDEIVKRYGASPLSQKHPDLQDLLDSYNSTFNHFRYVFEGNYTTLLNFDVDTQFEVLGFLRTTIEDLESFQPST